MYIYIYACIAIYTYSYIVTQRNKHTEGVLLCSIYFKQSNNYKLVTTTTHDNITLLDLICGMFLHRGDLCKSFPASPRRALLSLEISPEIRCWFLCQKQRNHLYYFNICLDKNDPRMSSASLPQHKYLN